MSFPTLQTRQRQQHTVTPRLQHAVRLLQLSSLDFAQEVQDAMGKNPFLELDESSDNPAAGEDGAGSALATPAGTTAETPSSAPEPDMTWERENWQTTGGSGNSASSSGDSDG